MSTRVPHHQNRQRQSEHRVNDAKIERGRAHAVALGDVAAYEGSRCESEITRELVQANRETARSRPYQIDLHDHRRGPRESLADAKKRVGEDDPAPARRP